MATATASIYIGGTQLLPYQVQVEQRSDWHHRFKITVATEKAKVLGDSESEIIDNAIAYAGEIAEINIERAIGSFNFKGYVTDVRVDQTYAGDAYIIFKGFSPTYLLDGQESVATYEELTLTDIFNDVMSSYPANTNKVVAPQYSKPIPYVVRYKETQFQFLSRLAATYGEWFYYDGQQIVFGELPGDSPSVELNFGSDSMLSFNYGINLRPSNFKQHFYKYQDNDLAEKSVAGFKPGWLDSHSKLSLDTANDLFPEEGLDPVTHAVKDTNHITHLAEAKKSSVLSDTMLFKGQSADPRIAVGAEIEVSSQKGFIGQYRVISVSHSFGSNSDYRNMFRAIPASSTAPPINKNVEPTRAESQVGLVTDNNDPEKLGRIRVQLKWQEGSTPWIRLQTNHAGEDRGQGIYGTYFIPEIGDEVMVEFEQGNPARPYAVGSLYHGSIPSEFADADNNLKAIKTRSGHILQFDDTEGDEKILITDKKGNLLRIEAKGDTIVVNAGNHIEINAGTSISMVAGSTIDIQAGDSITLTTTDINMIAGATTNISALAAINIATSNMTESIKNTLMVSAKDIMNSAKNNNTSTAKNFKQSAKDSIKTTAKEKITVTAKNKLEQRAGKMDLMTQKGDIKLKSKGKVEAKGKQIKLN